MNIYEILRKLKICLKLNLWFLDRKLTQNKIFMNINKADGTDVRLVKFIFAEVIKDT